MASSSTMRRAHSLSSSIAANGNLDHRCLYKLPSWAENAFTNLPSNGRLQLGNFPTPLYKLTKRDATNSLTLAGGGVSLLQKLHDLDITLFVKRDDMSGGVETGGNKIRKLEFLLADALAQGYKSIVTIGGEQSNHCRATAATARMLGLEPHIILRTRRADQVQKGEQNFGFVGNILFDRMVGTSIYTCTPGEYGRVGSVQLVSRLCDHLAASRPTGPPYPIPVGGSNGLGSWGYINGVDELMAQLENAHVHIPRDDRSYAVEVGLRNLRRRKTAIEQDGRFLVSDEDRPLMEYYAASISHLFRNRSKN